MRSSKSNFQLKQSMIMNIIFAIYFRVITVLNSFGDDQCLELNIVSDEINQVFQMLF